MAFDARQSLSRGTKSFGTLALLVGVCSCEPPANGEPTSAELSNAPSDETSGLHVGVIPAVNGANTECPLGRNRVSVMFQMHNENATRCTVETGDRGEPPWLPPHAPKYGPYLGCTEHPGPDPTFTFLRFCRTAVSTDAFRPLTTDPNALDEFYAVLMFGERCPPHSIEIQKRIVNNEWHNQNHYYGGRDTNKPNYIGGEGLGNFTLLSFCYFRNAPSAAETMSSFPDLGFPYGVFHDFEGKQPGWVLAKYSTYSDDFNGADSNTYEPEPSESAETREFQSIVENPEQELMDGSTTHDTCFDVARVR